MAFAKKHWYNDALNKNRSKKMQKSPAMLATPILNLEESKKIIKLASVKLSDTRKKQLQEQAELARQAFNKKAG